MPRLRRIALVSALLGSCGAAAGSALAADQDVAARNLAFTPGTVALQPGDTLTIRHDDRLIAHDLQFTDEAAKRVDPPATGWVVQRTFTAAESRDAPYTFFCSVHPGMSGRVYVNATGTVPPSPTPSPTPSSSPTATPTPSPGANATPGGGDATGAPAAGGPAVAVLRSAAVAPRACVRRGPRCRRPGVRLRIDLSAPADVRGTLRRRAPGNRRFEAFGSLRFGTVAGGPRTLTFSRTAGRRLLKPGRYRLSLRAAGARRALAFRVL